MHCMGTVMSWTFTSWIPRRVALLSMTRLAGLGLLSTWSQACGRALFKGGGIGSSHLNERSTSDSGATPSEQLPVEEGPITDANTERTVSSQLLNCDVFSRPSIDTTKLAPASGDLIPALRFYGNAYWGMLAMQFKTPEELVKITVLHTDGSPIALHIVTPADKSPAGYRPMILENLPLKNAAKIRLIITTAKSSQVYEAAIAFATTFNGLPVVDLGNKSVAPTFAANQSFAQFAETAGTFSKDTTVTYPNDFNGATVRNLQTAISTTTWVQGAGVKGIITDIMGTVIPTLSGSALLEYQTFCTYVLVQNQYIRTTLKVG